MSQYGENIEQNDLDISNRNDLENENDNKLNINSKSSREILPKEEKAEDKPTKENIEKTIEKENDEKNKIDKQEQQKEKKIMMNLNLWIKLLNYPLSLIKYQIHIHSN